MDINSKQFSNSHITVTYDPSACVNAGICAKQLSEVFRTSVIPWINLEGAETEKIINQINKCPSGALKFSLDSKDVA